MRRGTRKGVRTAVRGKRKQVQQGSPLCDCSSHPGSGFEITHVCRISDGSTTPSAWNDEDELRICGAGFGTKSQAPPILFDRVDDLFFNGTKTTPYPDAGLSDGDTIPVYWPPYPWENNAWDSTKYWTTSGPPYGVRNASYGGERINGDRWMSDMTEILPLGVFTFYLNFRVRISWDITGDTGSNKWCRVWDASREACAVSWTQRQTTYCDGPPESVTGANTGYAYPTPNQWAIMELCASHNDDHLWARMDNSLVHDVDDYRPNASITGMRLSLMGFDGSNCSTCPSGSTCQNSDVYWDDTLTRVEIGNSGVALRSSSIRECQIPTYWSNTEIRFKLNQGALGSFSNKHVYVVKGNDSVETISSGYSL